MKRIINELFDPE